MPFFTGLTDQPADGLLALMQAYRADGRTEKLDLGIGVFRDTEGNTPVMAAVKAAEAKLAQTQSSKIYLGVDGDTEFVRRLAVLPFGPERAQDPRLVGLQTPGGTGALRLAAELLAQHTAAKRIWTGAPTWANHAPIFRAAGVEVLAHPFFDPASGRHDLAAMLAGLEQARPGDALLLHGCAHNPTGVDLLPEEWEAIGTLVDRRQLIPVVDLAYQGLGRGLEADAFGTRHLFDRCETMILAYSCDKNFGLYRERTGALWAKAPDAATAPRLHVAMRNPARTSWSMPPDHGAAVVRVILESEELTDQWRCELDAMLERIRSLRSTLADAHPALDVFRSQTGLFAMLPLTRDEVMTLRRDHAIYVADDGRINVAGLSPVSICRLADAIEPFLRAPL